MIVNDPDIVAEVTAAFMEYERALMADDIPAMDRIFHQAPTSVRYGVGEVLYGYDEIAAFRRGRGGSPQRRLGKVAIATYGRDFATANAEFFREGADRRGRQSQSWVRFDDGWKVVSAHISLEGDAFMTLDAVNELSKQDFVRRFGFLFDHSPWVVEQAAARRPFADRAAMEAALRDVVAEAGEEAQLAILRAHPELASKAAIDGGLTDASAAEQAAAGLDRMTPQEFANFHDFNDKYRIKHGFPFIICVRLTDKVGILTAMARRLNNDRSAEIAAALAEVGKIVHLRLSDALTGVPA